MNMLIENFIEELRSGRCEHASKWVKVFRERGAQGWSDIAMAANTLCDSSCKTFGLAWLCDGLRGDIQPDRLRTAKRLAKKHALFEQGQPLRVAVLSGYAPQLLSDILKTMLLREGFNAEIYLAGFNQIRQEILDYNSVLHQQEWDIVLIWPSHTELKDLFTDTDTKVKSTVDEWRRLWQALLGLKNSPALIHLSYFHPCYDGLGWGSDFLPEGWVRILGVLNRELCSAAAGIAQFVMFESIVRRHGWNNLHDPAFYAAYSQWLSEYGCIILASALSALIRTMRCGRRKCLITDLDNTLWGGILGEDGTNLSFSENDAVGQGHAAYQEYLQSLQRSGVLLAVCSKNDPDAVTTALQNMDMPLQKNDFAAIKAGWREKPAMIMEILDDLKILPDSCLFVDDSPQECAAVRAAYPEMAVFQFPADSALAVTQLESCRFFEATALTEEDTKRLADLSADTARKAAREQRGSLKDYYRSLQQHATFHSIEGKIIPRAAQLTQKTNQFNARTIRYTESAIQNMLADPDQSLGFAVSVRDIYADSGIIGVVIALRGNQTEWFLDTFLLSCRVIGRTVERSAFSFLCRQLAKRKASALVAEYRPTGRNGLMAGLFEQLGMKAVSENECGALTYRLENITETGCIKNPFIRENIDAYGN